MSVESGPHAVPQTPTNGVMAEDYLDQHFATLAGAIIIVGIVLRVRQYLFDRSLWFDETLLSLNIIHRHLSELLGRLDSHQGAPVGFLMLSRLAVDAFGTSEYALRLVPFLAGVAS